jgi:hypothetical protein
MSTLTAPAPESLAIAGVTLRYRPLSGFGCADYIEEHAHLLEASGAFDSLKYGAAELRFSKESVDLSGLAALGSAFATLLTKSVKDSGAKTLRTLITDHCSRFAVQVNVDGTWVNLDNAEIIDARLDFGQMLDVLAALSGGVLRPLWNRLRSSAEEQRRKSAEPSTSATPES